MIRKLFLVGVAGATGFAGWLGGSIWPAPPEWTDTINRQANDLRATMRLENVSLAKLVELTPRKTIDDLQKQFNDVAVAAGEIIMIERDSGTREEQLGNLALTEAEAMSALPAPAAAGTAAAKPASSLSLCPRMNVQNAPPAQAGVVSNFKAVVKVKEARISTFPAPGACLSSGYGPRSDRLHKGVDYHAEEGVMVVSAGDGVIVEMKYRDDYGNMMLIDHGGGVYTRYAHLASFGSGLSPGVTLRAGDAIGRMGNTAAYAIPIHLHYELLLGDYKNPKGSFGLEPADPFVFPSAG